MKNNLEKTIDYSLYLLIISGIISIIIYFLNVNFFILLIFISLCFFSLIAFISQIYLLCFDVESLLPISKSKKIINEEPERKIQNINSEVDEYVEELDIEDFCVEFQEDASPFGHTIEMKADFQSLQSGNQPGLNGEFKGIGLETIKNIQKKLKTFRLFMVFSFVYIAILTILVMFFDILRMVLIIVLVIYVIMAVDIIRKIRDIKNQILSFA